jgi:3-hydroxymyristoyl/3-hydroxydecanoyl-(acyl carrier protein) dehydratase
MVEGVFVCTANDRVAEVMIVEAMAQLAGSIVFDAQGWFTGIDRCEILRAAQTGDVVTMRVTLEAEFGGTYRFSGTGSIDGVEAIRGRFYLSGAQP